MLSPCWKDARSIPSTLNPPEETGIQNTPKSENPQCLGRSRGGTTGIFLGYHFCNPLRGPPFNQDNIREA